MDTVPDTVKATPTDERSIATDRPNAALKHGTSRPELTRIADSLEDEYQIGHVRDHPRLYRRYVILRSTQIFERLTILYRRQFNANWQLFRRTVEAFELPPNTQDPLLYAARCYVSGWFWDLYVSNRKCVEKLSHTALAQHYNTQIFHSCDRYDPLLQHLNSIIRPTHIQNALEDSLYLPLIDQTINFNVNDNPFNITNFMMNETLVQGLQDVMDQKNNAWTLFNLSDNTMGRPMWLLDWRNNQGYAWFPSEGNYSREDLVAAQILGIPCSPRLGPRDFDDWQIFPGGTLPATIDLTTLQRITPRHFYGAAEYRTISTGQWTIPIQTGTTTREITEDTRGKRPRSEGQASEEVESHMSLTPPGFDTQRAQSRTIQVPSYTTVYRYQIIDWTYHARVVLGINEQKQNQALRSFLFPKN